MAGEETLTPGLSMIHANHPEDLRQVAVEWIRRRPLKPLENELFLVQSNGMAQWLKLALAENDGCGIAAAVKMELPARFLWLAYRAVLGEAEIPEESPYDKDRLTWRLLQLLPSLTESDCFAQLARYLAGDKDLQKRYQLAGRLSDLFDQYQVYRADWLEDWTIGHDRIRNAAGMAAEMPEKQRWQAELWRRIQDSIPLSRRGSSRSALHSRFLKKVKSLAARPAGLPRRVIVFGICSLPQQALEALHAVSRLSQVMVFVHNPCRHYWADIIEDKDLLRIERARHPRKPRMPENLNSELLHQHVNPLLAAWGKQGRDYMGLLYAYDRPESYRNNFAQIDLFRDHAPEGSKSTLLQQVQQAILDLQPLPAGLENRQRIDSGDASIRFHLAHSPQREVEILQDQLLSFFDSDPDLRPRDIMVMTPDIDVYAPHIEAVFGNIRPQDARYFPFTIADSPERGAVPILQALKILLHLPESRMAVGDVMDLLDVPAVRERFGLTDADLPRLRQWMEGSGIRWGLSAGHRAGFALPDGLDQNTWLFGLRRMLLGYAVGAGEPWQGIEPYDEVCGLEAARVGPLYAMLETLERHRQVLVRPATAKNWCRRILDLSKDCFQAVDSADRMTLGRVEAVLETWLSACRDAGLEESLPLTVVRDAFLGAMQASGMSQRFLAGMVNFCTLMPMRAIPFKVICLLGMNDGKYPRSRPPLDFDLMAAPGVYRPGDRSRREDDRYLFLEALLAARRIFYISYIGRSIRDNSLKMPSVLVGQLRDYLAAGWRPAEILNGSGSHGAGGEADLLDQLTCRHPLQPFSKSYFLPGASPGRFTYAREWSHPKNHRQAPFPEIPLTEEYTPPRTDAVLKMNDLIRFLKNPVQFYFNQRLNVYFDSVQAVAEDLEPFGLDRLAPYTLGARLLAAGLAAESGDFQKAVHEESKRLLRAGSLPLMGIGELAAAELTDPVLRMIEYHRRLCDQWPNPADAMEIRQQVQVPQPPLDGPELPSRYLEDWLDGLRRADSARPECYARWEFYCSAILNSRNEVSRLPGLLNAWVKHLAGCAQGILLTSFVVAPDGVAELAPLQKNCAENNLLEITATLDTGLMQPLSVTAKTALAYLAILKSVDLNDTPEMKQQKARAAVRKVYQGNGYNDAGELGYSLYLARTYPDFNALWQADGNRFDHLATALYAPLLEAVRVHEI